MAGSVNPRAILRAAVLGYRASGQIEKAELLHRALYAPQRLWAQRQPRRANGTFRRFGSA